MKYLKYLILSFCILISFFIASEINKLKNSDYSCFVRFEINDLTADTAEWRLQTFSDLMQKNGLEFFIVGEKSKEQLVNIIDVCFSDKGIKNICEKQYDRHDGMYKSIVSGKTEVIFHDGIMQLAQEKNIPARLYLCLSISEEEVAGLEYKSDYLLENMIRPEERKPYNLIISLIFFLDGCILILLSLIDVYFSKKEIFVKLSYGNDYKALIGHDLLRELLGTACSFLLPLLLLNRFIAIPSMDKHVLIMSFVFLLTDFFVILLPYFVLDFRGALGKGEKNTKILSGCYIIRTILIIISIILLSAGIQRMNALFACLKYDKLMEMYKGYVCISDDSGFDTDWSDKLVLDSIMTLNANDGKKYDVIIANDNAQRMLYGFLDDDAFDYTEAICIYYPGELKGAGIDERDEGFLVSLLTDDYINNKVMTSFYSGGKTLEYLGIQTFSKDCVVLDDTFTIQKSYSPIIVYVPEGCTSIYTQTRCFAKNDKADIQNGFDIYESYLESVSLYKLQTIVVLVVGIMFIFFHFTLRRIIMKMEYSVNAMELCLKTIYGMGFFEKYKRIISGSIASHIVGVLISCFMTRSYLREIIVPVIITGVMLLLIDIIMELREAGNWEKRHVIHILKGGAL